MNFETKTSRDRKKLTVKKWSHQDHLSNLKGKKIKVTRIGGQMLWVKLIDADQFTIKVTDNAGNEEVIFKHSIFSYSPIEKQE